MLERRVVYSDVVRVVKHNKHYFFFWGLGAWFVCPGFFSSFFGVFLPIVPPPIFGSVRKIPVPPVSPNFPREALPGPFWRVPLSRKEGPFFQGGFSLSRVVMPKKVGPTASLAPCPLVWAFLPLEFFGSIPPIFPQGIP